MDCELACSLSSNYCIDCDAGQAELTKCTMDGDTFVQRECADVRAGYYSPKGDNEEHECDPGTFAAVSGSSRCDPCTRCSAAKQEDAECTRTTDRTCKDVDANY